MSETLGQVLSYINEVLPNSMNSSTIVTFINDEIKEFWTYLTSTNYHDALTTIAGQPIYSLPTDITIDMIVENGVMIGDSTNPVSSTTIFQSYSYAGADETLEGNKYYDALGQLGIYPIPTTDTDGYPIRIRYQEPPTLFASSDLAESFNLDSDYIKLIKYRTLARVAKSGKFPRPDLANNYESDAKEIERKMKIRSKIKKAKTPRDRWSYTEGWDY